MLLSVRFMLSAAVRSATAVLVAALVVTATGAAPSKSEEVRALWVVRTTLTSPEAVRTLVAAARAGGFNTLLVQVRGRGDAYYQGGLEPRPAALAAQPGFDPLAETIAHAHDAGLTVHAWINVNLVAGLELPASREHVVYRHPEWLMVPRPLAAELTGVDPRSPEYLGRLARYARSRSAEVEGIYLSPVPPAAADYTTGIVRDIAARYLVDGIHLDYIRYPDEDFDYGRQSIAEFHRSVPESLRTPERWRAFRADRLTSLLTRVRAAVHDVRPDAILSAAVAPDAAEAAAHRLQDWHGWLRNDLLDVICPMAYTTDAALFATQIAAVRQAAGERPTWAGIGAYRLSAGQIAANVQTARKLGVSGIILFSYDSLTDPAHGQNYLTQVGRAAFSQ
jgi:uncharacterized lipoprotein YddW (UPF0748 family)